MTSGLRVYRIRIEGFITEDFGEGSLKPDSWPMDAIVEALGGNVKVDAALVDAIPWESETEGDDD